MSSKNTKIQAEKKVPENVQKRRERDAKLSAQREKAATDRAAHLKSRAAEYLKRAETRRTALIAQRRELVNQRRQARASASFFVPAEAKVIVVVRIRGINRLSPQVRQILKLLKLRQLHNASFIRVNKATINLLRKVEPYIAYGYPSRKTVADLILKRGFAKVNKQRIPINNNEVVEQALGKHGIVCVDDLIHELTTCGPKFKEANTFLWYFKLNSPKGGFNNKRHPFQKGGDWGNREELINDLIQRML